MASNPTSLPQDHPLQKLKAKKSVAEKTAADWIKPGGGYDKWKKDDPQREKKLPPGADYPKGYDPSNPNK